MLEIRQESYQEKEEIIASARLFGDVGPQSHYRVKLYSGDVRVWQWQWVVKGWQRLEIGTLVIIYFECW